MNLIPLPILVFTILPRVFLLAWGLTASIFIGLSGYVWVTKKDFNYLGAGLFSFLWIIIITSLIQIVFLPHSVILRTVIAACGACVACGYILYDTSEIVLRATPDEYVWACLNLYVDIIMLFLRLLELFGDRRE